MIVVHHKASKSGCIRGKNIVNIQETTQHFETQLWAQNTKTPFFNLLERL